MPHRADDVDGSSSLAGTSTVVDAAPPASPRTRDRRHRLRRGSKDLLLLERERMIAADRWRWRRRVRANPSQLAVYRVGVGVVGLLFVLAGLATGWIPGPGGIPLILLGLAVWASEFLWAHRLMWWAKRQLRRYARWSRRHPVLAWAMALVACAVGAYTALAVFGVPGWLPDPVEGVLRALPGL